MGEAPVREGRRQLTSGAWPTGWTARSVSVRHRSSTWWRGSARLWATSPRAALRVPEGPAT